MDSFEYDFNVFKPAFVRQVQSWFWINQNMRKFISSLDRLVTVEHSEIIIDLRGFHEYYTDRYAKPDLDKYGTGLVEWMRPYLYEFTKLIGYTGYGYQVKISLSGKTFEKSISITIKDELEP